MDAALQRMGRGGGLSAAEEALVLSLEARRGSARAGTELLVEGGAEGPKLLLSGWAAYQRMLSDGRRQILGLLVAGDLLGDALQSRPPACSVVALTDVVTADASALVTAVRAGASPGLARAFGSARREHDAQVLGAIVRLGGLTAFERVAHLLLELGDRMAGNGLGARDRYAMPLTQEVLSDALGLSIVHTNRTLQQFRREGLIELRAGRALLLDRKALQRIAQCEGRSSTPSAPVRTLSEPVHPQDAGLAGIATSAARSA
jgi:CRP-like cAMP-binding protein